MEHHHSERVNRCKSTISTGPFSSSHTVTNDQRVLCVLGIGRVEKALDGLNGKERKTFLRAQRVPALPSGDCTSFTCKYVYIYISYDCTIMMTFLIEIHDDYLPQSYISTVSCKSRNLDTSSPTPLRLVLFHKPQKRISRNPAGRQNQFLQTQRLKPVRHCNYCTLLHASCLDSCVAWRVRIFSRMAERKCKSLGRLPTSNQDLLIVIAYVHPLDLRMHILYCINNINDIISLSL